MKFIQQPVFHPTFSNNSINQNGAHMLLETLIRMPHISLSVGVAYMGVDDNFILRHLRDFRRLKAKWSRLFALNLISLWRVGSGVWRVVRGQIRILIHKMFDCLDSTCLFVPLSNLQWHCLWWQFFNVGETNQIQLVQLCVTRWWSCVLGQYRTAMAGTELVWGGNRC